VLPETEAGDGRQKERDRLPRVPDRLAGRDRGRL